METLCDIGVFRRCYGRRTILRIKIEYYNVLSHFELSESLGLSNDETKHLLQISGFEWDRQKMMYILGEKRNEVIEKLSSIDVFYDGI